MVCRVLDWHDELEDWLEPFLTRLGHKTRALKPDVGPCQHSARRNEPRRRFDGIDVYSLPQDSPSSTTAPAFPLHPSSRQRLPCWL
jgi:hypothetical protein